MEFEKEVCQDYGIRMSKKDKEIFRKWVIQKAQSMGFDAKEEKSIFAKNVVIGNAEKAEYIIGAHYDTPPAMTPFMVKHQFLTIGLAYPIAMFTTLQGALHWTAQNIPTEFLGTALDGVRTGAQLLNFGVCAYLMGFMGNANKTNYDDNSSGVMAVLGLMNKIKDMPKSEKDKVAFVFFDNEEKMLWGSSIYSSKHKKEIINQNVINLDCIGVAETMNLLYFSMKPTELSQKLYNLMVEKNGHFTPNLKRTTLLSMSDHIAFHKAKSHVCMLAKDKSIYSLVEHIHCKNDTQINEKNIKEVQSLILDLITNQPKISTKSQLKNTLKTKQSCELTKEENLNY